MAKEKDYSITITETLERIVTVKAKSSDEAYELVNDAYREEKIVLDAEDHINTNICKTKTTKNTY